MYNSPTACFSPYRPRSVCAHKAAFCLGTPACQFFVGLAAIGVTRSIIPLTTSVSVAPSIVLPQTMLQSRYKHVHRHVCILTHPWSEHLKVGLLAQRWGHFTFNLPHCQPELLVPIYSSATNFLIKATAVFNEHSLYFRSHAT